MLREGGREMIRIRVGDREGGGREGGMEGVWLSCKLAVAPH